MSLKSKLTPDSRIKLLIALGPLSGLAFVLNVYIGRLQDPGQFDRVLCWVVGRRLTAAGREAVRQQLEVLRGPDLHVGRPIACDVSQGASVYAELADLLNDEEPLESHFEQEGEGPYVPCTPADFDADACEAAVNP